jgi:hypothetical protein
MAPTSGRPRLPWARGGGVGALPICCGAVALSALAVVAVRVLNAPPQVAVALAGGRCGLGRAFALPANALRAPKRLTTPAARRAEPFGAVACSRRRAPGMCASR